MTDINTKLNVNLAERSYPIYIGEHLLAQNLLRSHIAGQQAFIVTNEKVASLYLDAIKTNLNDLQCDQIILPDGEAYKTLESVNLIFEALIKNKHRRNTTLIALGGGVIGDMTGFAAACYQRGVNFIQVPTTLLGQVDASVGGKTAVNHPQGKNMIGAFYQPRAVLIDIHTLLTLPTRQFSCGLAEVIKAALICDEDFFCWLEQHITNLLNKETPTLIHAIKQACSIKIKIVTADEKEANVRALLNLGHTFAHAIEQMFGYSDWLHGEAVAVGLVLAADYSYRLGWIDHKILERIKNVLTLAQLPIKLPADVNAQQLLSLMSFDKKMASNDLKLVLIKAIGQVVVSTCSDLKLLEATIHDNQLSCVLS